MPVATRFLRALTAIFMGVSVVTCAHYYDYPKDASDAAFVSGDSIQAPGSDEWAILLTPHAVDGQLLGHRTGVHNKQKYAARPRAIEAGTRKIGISRDRRLTNSFSADFDVISWIEADLEAGEKYQITGTIIVGSAFKYWIEEVDTKQRVSQVFYDPHGLKEELQSLEALPAPTADYAELKWFGRSFFTNKTALKPGHDCFRIIDERTPAASAASAGLAVLAVLGKGTPGDPEYGFAMSEEICLDVEPRHVYEVHLGYKTIVHRGQREEVKMFQVVDRTAQRLLLEFSPRELALEIIWAE